MTTPTIQLDFDQIKADIIAYIKNDTTFSDYNFEGSALNSIIDILAYNTHTNAYYANMLHAEGFIDTAQKRGSVVSKAKELGYVPRSATGSIAYVDITLSGDPANTQFFTLPRGSIFTSSNSNGNYTFLSETDEYSVMQDGVHKFLNVKLIAGVRATNKFKVDPITNIRSIFSIPNNYIDTSTLKVHVRDDAGSLDKSEYLYANNVYELSETTKCYFIQEAYDGLFQIYFGQNILGVQPIVNNIVEVDYFICKDFGNANDCLYFVYSGSIENSTLIVNTVQKSFSGSDKETLDSIKHNAVKTNAAKSRTITVSDYEAYLKSNFSFIKSVSVWGGENNVPPVYGKVFISIQPVTGYTITDSIKESLLIPALKKTSMITVTPAFVNPDYVMVDFYTTIKYNENKAAVDKPTLAALVKTVIADYVTSISAFNTDYLETELITNIVDLDAGITSIDIKKTIGFDIVPLVNVTTRYEKFLNNNIVVGSIVSSKFYVYVNSATIAVTLKDVPNSSVKIADSTGAYHTHVSLGLYDDSSNLISTIGTANLDTGYFIFTLTLSSYITESRLITVRATPVNLDITVSNNQIIVLETATTDSIIGITNANEVIMVNYVK